LEDDMTDEAPARPTLTDDAAVCARRDLQLGLSEAELAARRLGVDLTEPAAAQAWADLARGVEEYNRQQEIDRWRFDLLRPLILSGDGSGVGTRLTDAATGEGWGELYSVRDVKVVFDDDDSRRPLVIVEMRPRLQIDVDTARRWSTASDAGHEVPGGGG
jgi:hypothetical protein